MTNREFYKEQILDIVCKGNQFGFDKRTNKPCDCSALCNSGECLFFPQKGESCNDYLEKWCNAEHIETCPFEEGELVEVSDDGKNWSLDFFLCINTDDKLYKYKTSTTDDGDISYTYNWKYCQKYGTLGKSLAKEIEE